MKPPVRKSFYLFFVLFLSAAVLGKEEVAFYGPCWADSSGRDGKGGVCIVSSGDDHRFLLRNDPCQEKVESRITAEKPEWVIFDSDKNSANCLSFEFTWVTTGDNKHFDRNWAGGGLAFNNSWASRDFSGAKFLVLYVKTDYPGLDFNVGFSGKVESGQVKLSDYAEGKKIRDTWTRVVVPFASFPNFPTMTRDRFTTLNFNLLGGFPENRRVHMRFDRIYVTDSALITPVENLGWYRLPDGVMILWDKASDEGVRDYQVTVDGKAVGLAAGASSRRYKLPSGSLTAGVPHEVGVAARSAKEISSFQAVIVTLSQVSVRTASVTLSTEPGRPISPYLWGYNYQSTEKLKQLGGTVNRWGGNATTTYNWKDNCENRGGDWFFLNSGGPPESGLEKDKGYAKFIAESFAAGSQVIMTIPTIGWVAKPSGKNGPRLCSFPTSKYPKQTATDGQGAGNGILPGNKHIRDNDPNYNYVPSTPEFQKEWVKTIVKLFGPATNGGVKFYQMDNEPGCWVANHRDLWPNGISYDELVDLNARYALTVKEADPGSQVIGWSGWGVMELAGSQGDYTPGGFKEMNVPDKKKKSREMWTDRKAHGNLPQVVWFLREMKRLSEKAGVQLIDYLDNHGCPDVWGVDASGKTISMAGNYPYDPVITPQQFEALRVFWDPTFENPQSWCANEANKPYLWDPFVGMIPRMKKIIAENYPGVKYAMTEYYASSPGYYHGGLLETAKLGIFMREGLDMACDWGGAAPDNYLFLAHRLYGNYDGKGSEVAGNTVNASSSSADLYSFGARDPVKTYVILVNKNHDSAIDTTVSLPANASTFSTYTISESSGKRIVDSGPQRSMGAKIRILMPSFSAVLVVAQ